MNARIRFGHEVDILNAIPGNLEPTELEPFRDLGRTVLSFSERVRLLPDEEEFGPILDEFGIKFKHDPLERGEGLIVQPVRMVEVVNPEAIDLQLLKTLGDSMIGLARDRGSLGNNGALFFDHTALPEGVIISYYDPLTGEVS